MRLAISWETTYRYSRPVRMLHTELRVVPAARFGQTVYTSDLTTDADTVIAAQTDAFGNTVHHFDVVGTVDQVHIRLDADVETPKGYLPEPELAPLERHLMLSATERSPLAPGVRAFIDDLPEFDDALAFGTTLLDRFADRFTFDAGGSEVEDTALDLLRVERGVCQDFAHLMLAAVRLHGIPARYVSGYLVPDDVSGQADASHAWVQIWHEGAWYGFDPANHARQDERYVIIGVGRDYDDVAPLRGSYRGTAVEDWQATVRVQSQPQA